MNAIATEKDKKAQPVAEAKEFRVKPDALKSSLDGSFPAGMTGDPRAGLEYSPAKSALDNLFAGNWIKLKEVDVPPEAAGKKNRIISLPQSLDKTQEADIATLTPEQVQNLAININKFLTNPKVALGEIVAKDTSLASRYAGEKGPSEYLKDEIAKINSADLSALSEVYTKRYSSDLFKDLAPYRSGSPLEFGKMIQKSLNFKTDPEILADIFKAVDGMATDTNALASAMVRLHNKGDIEEARRLWGYMYPSEDRLESRVLGEVTFTLDSFCRSVFDGSIANPYKRAVLLSEATQGFGTSHSAILGVLQAGDFGKTMDAYEDRFNEDAIFALRGSKGPWNMHGAELRQSDYRKLIEQSFPGSDKAFKLAETMKEGVVPFTSLLDSMNNEERVQTLGMLELFICGDEQDINEYIKKNMKTGDADAAINYVSRIIDAQK